MWSEFTGTVTYISTLEILLQSLGWAHSIREALEGCNPTPPSQRKRACKRCLILFSKAPLPVLSSLNISWQLVMDH